MMTEPLDWLARLTRSLHPLDTPLADLTIGGFMAPDEHWRPRSAAVLIVVVPDPFPSVVLTVRGSGMAKHAGQVSLPGGGRAGDEQFPSMTALRETAEEVGLAADRVRLIGLLDHFDTISAYRVTPVVGWVDTPVCLQACPREVHEVFTVPLNQVLALDSYRQHRINRNGLNYEFWSMKAAAHWTIWGATAAILRELALRYAQDPA